MSSKEAEDLLETLTGLQEKKGYFFNPDREYVLGLLEGLLTNKARYGYMSCPCRLATRDREKDRDVICPCAFREEDVKLYGRCYCNLYQSKDVLNHKVQAARQVPERWTRK